MKKILQLLGIVLLIFTINACKTPTHTIINGVKVKNETVEPVTYIENEENLDFVTIEEVEISPVFPDCSGNDDEIRKCFSKLVHIHVSKEYKADLVQELGLSPGRKRLELSFIIDKYGNIKNAKSVSTIPILNKEAVRVLNTLPKMIPGQQENASVNVQFTMPIIFEVVDDF